MTSQRPAGPRSRRPVILLIIALLTGALLLTLLAVGTVTYLVLSRKEEPAAAPTFATYEAPSPMTQVDTDYYSFSYPQNWQPEAPGEDISSFEYVLTTLDAAENSKMAVMDYAVDNGIEDECRSLAEDLRYEEMPEVKIDGRVALHFQSISEDPESGETKVEDLWCVARHLHMVVILGRTSGPEAEAAGISEAQKVIDSWKWADEE